MRRVWVSLHRWLGLFMAGFLFVSGLTGAIIAWDHELDEWLNPELFHARASDQPVSDTDVTLLNEALTEAPSRDALSKTRTQFGWKVPRGEITAPSILAPVLWPAADLLLKGDPARIRQCANEKCRWVFLDTSKAGARRWCTMNSCGNRAKAHRHYHKAKAAKS